MTAFLSKTNPDGSSASGQATNGGSVSAPTPTPTPLPASTPLPTLNPALTLDSTLQEVVSETFALIDPPENQEKLILWPECQESGPQLALLSRGEKVRVLRLGNQWCQVQYDLNDPEKIGFCLESCISVQVK